MIGGRRRTLRGKTVLLTGAAGGIGQELARALAREGAILILVDRDDEGLRALHAALAPAPVTLRTVDLASPTELDALVASVRGQRLDVLINNAGVVYGRSFARMTPPELERTIDVDLRAVMRLSLGLLPALVESRGFIANIASAAGLAGAGGMCAYSAAKAGVIAFSQALRAELREQGVGVSVICPGFVRTDIVRTSARLGSAAEAPQVERLNRLVRALGQPPGRVVRAVLRSIEEDLGVVPLGGAVKALLVASFLSPRLGAWINSRAYLALKRRGLIT
jgi:short-subunit dehydrogenase